MTVDTIETGGGEVSLADAADAWGPEDSGEAQPALVSDGQKVTFVGVSMDALDEANYLKLGQEAVFLVKGLVVETGTKIMQQDGHRRPVAKVKVSSVIPHQ